MKQLKKIGILVLVFILEKIYSKRKSSSTYRHASYQRGLPQKKTTCRSFKSNDSPLSMLKANPVKKKVPSREEMKRTTSTRDQESDKEVDDVSVDLPKIHDSKKEEPSVSAGKRDVSSSLSNTPSSSSKSNNIIYIALLAAGVLLGVSVILIIVVYVISKRIAANRRRLRYMESLKNSTYTKKGDGLDEYREVLEQ